MSYYTRLELTWDDSDLAKGSLVAEDILAAAKSFVDQTGWSADVLLDLRAAAAPEGNGLENAGFNKVYSDGVIDLLQHISKALPEVTFYGRGVGEELWDMWFREFRAGNVVKEFGPFDTIESNAASSTGAKPWWARWKKE